MKSTSKKKLVLSRATVRALNSDQLAAAAGGRPPQTLDAACKETDSCHTAWCTSFLIMCI